MKQIWCRMSAVSPEFWTNDYSHCQYTYTAHAIDIQTHSNDAGMTTGHYHKGCSSWEPMAHTGRETIIPILGKSALYTDYMLLLALRDIDRYILTSHTIRESELHCLYVFGRSCAVERDSCICCCCYRDLVTLD